MISKNALYHHCLNSVENTIKDIEELILDAREALKGDTKSSMGDKYETTREMMQAEIEKLMRQLAESKQMLLTLKVLDPDKKCQRAEIGALVSTQNHHFFLAAAMGKTEFQGTPVMVISTQSPLGKALIGKMKGDTVVVNGKNHSIVEIQ